MSNYLEFVILSLPKDLLYLTDPSTSVGMTIKKNNMKVYYVYIMASLSGVLYIGITNNIDRRVYEHKNGVIEGFSKKYRCTKLVFYEQSSDVKSVLEREKQIKGWTRAKKIALIDKSNPGWIDLSENIE